MECEWMILCHAVEDAPMGGRAFVGIIGRLVVDELPAETPNLVAAFRIRGVPNESFELSIEVVSPGGNLLVGSPVLEYRMPGYGAMDSSMTLGRLPVKRFGVYQVVLLLNGRSSKTTLLQVDQIVH